MSEMAKDKITVTHKNGVKDPEGEQLKRTLKAYFPYNVEELEVQKIYAINKLLTKEQLQTIADGPLVDPIVEESFTGDKPLEGFDWSVYVGYKPGLTDNTGQTAQLTIEDFLGVKFQANERVNSARKYLIKGVLTQCEVEHIAHELLANPLIEEIQITKYHKTLAERIPINVDDRALMTLSRDRQLALELEEMVAIRDHFSCEDVIAKREAIGLDDHITDVELEALAQTWSEHCKHKIFLAKITYKEGEVIEVVDSLFKTYIKKATDELAPKKDWLVSVFSDNAGIVRFDEDYNLAFKVETHNSPSALDPYGGALTGILGVNRDIMGAGRGARLLANTDVFCFAPPTYSKPIPKRLLQPKRIFEGVRRGVEHGGNKSGVPTVNGAIVYDERYLGKPLVYCGTVGLMPNEVQGTPSHIKEILPGDHIVIAGGRTGKDGIHGATFSSQGLHADSPTSAVQIGDPFTQKKLHDFLLEARDQGLYRTVTDNGAGGFSSSVGELAELSGGCEIHLDRALLKYDGMSPWEILVSESQERMTLAVDMSHWKMLESLARKHEVEIVSIGTFTDTGKFHVLTGGETVAYLDMDFLHNGVPQMELEGEWCSPPETPIETPEHFLSIDPHEILSRENICSKESIIRQYDHEVQGGTILKPLQGVVNDGPGDAAVIQPIECWKGNAGVVISNGICPRYSDLDAYHMAANAIDEAIRNAVAVGADPSTIAILDNFCWPDPVGDKMKTAQLVRANKALYDYSIAFETPIISGKDSMKNDYHIDGVKISVPPTLLISAIGKVPDITKCVTTDVKNPGDWVYVVGLTKNELGGSEYALMRGHSGGIVPKVDPTQAMTLYRQIFLATEKGILKSCHDCSDGGLIVALLESAFGGGYGMTLDLGSVPVEQINTDTELLFSESASRFVITISPEDADLFETLFANCPFGRVGVVAEGELCHVTGLHGDTIIEDNISAFKRSWQTTLRGSL